MSTAAAGGRNTGGGMRAGTFDSQTSIGLDELREAAEEIRTQLGKIERAINLINSLRVTVAVEGLEKEGRNEGHKAE